MTLSAFLAGLLAETLRDPRSAARRLLALDPPMEARWIGLLLISVLTLIAAKLMLASVPAEEIQPWEQVWANAWAGLPIQISSLALFAVAVTWIGSLFGGTGRFSDALLAVTWVQGVMLVPQAVQILIFPVLPGVSGLIALGSVVLFFYLLSQFICVVHGFRSAVAVFFVVIGTLLALGIVLAVLFTMLGVLPVGPEA
ncbi:MAG: Yip1 family protein [Paracoccaceae bacterium]